MRLCVFTSTVTDIREEGEQWFLVFGFEGFCSYEVSYAKVRQIW